MRLIRRDAKRVEYRLALALASLGGLLLSLSGCGLGGSGYGADKPAESPSLPAPIACDSCWHPPVKLAWQLQLSGSLDSKPVASMYEIDMFDDTAAQVHSLHALGRKVICYVDAGSWEKWRPDAKSYPKSILGKPLQGWPGERWVNIRRLDLLGPILSKRVNTCKSKGFDGVDFDNVDGYQNATGFHLTGTDQLRFNTYLANLAHGDGLMVLLKNDPDQVRTLDPYFDGTVVEQCFQYQECNQFTPFVSHGKPVFEVEYSLPKSRFCSKAKGLHFNAMKKRLELGPWLSRC